MTVYFPLCKIMFNPLTPVPAAHDKPWALFHVITFDQNWHHLHSSSAGGKNLSNHTQIRVIGSMEPQIWWKMFRNLNEKLQAKFPATTCGYSMAKNDRPCDAFLEKFEWEANPVEGQSMQQKDKKRRKRKRKKNLKKSKDQGHRSLLILISTHAWAKLS